MSSSTQGAAQPVIRPHPEIEPRLLAQTSGREDLASYRQAGGYRPVTDAQRLLDEIDASGLRGRGGAAFPTGRKMRAVRATGGVPVVVANGEEGEPTSIKDRWLLRNRPHLVLDGLRLAAFAVGADLAHVYVSDPASERSVRTALAEATASKDWDLNVSVVTVEPAYVAGEETAVVRAINGGPALPTDKPPRPYEEGVDGRPTLVSNVETLANIPFVHAFGADAYRAVGTPSAPGTFLLTLGGSVRQSGLFEVPLGISLRDLLRTCGEDVDAVTGVLMGGYFAGLLNQRALDITLDYDALSAAGSGLGCGAITILGPKDCPVPAAAATMAYFARESAGQCGSCFNGTAAMSAVLGALRDHKAEQSDFQRLADWSVKLRGRGACGTLDGATNLAASLIREFPNAVNTHLDGTCDICTNARPMSDPPFAFAFPETDIAPAPQGTES